MSKLYTSGKISKDHAFILYDTDDAIMYYFDNYYELSKFINLPSWNLAIRYNKERSDMINIVFDGVLRKLYTFDRNER